MKNIFLLLLGFYCFHVKSQTCSISASVNPICSGQSSTLTITHDLPIGSTILWTGNFSTPTITVNPSATSIYNCTVENGTSSCIASLTVTVNSVPSISSTSPSSRCDAGLVTLGAIPIAGVVNWYTSPTGGTSLFTGNTYSPTVSTSTTFYVDATNNGCTSPRTAVTATVNPTPSITSPSQTICSSNSFSIAPTNGTGNIVPTNTTYTWSAPSVAGITGTLSANNASIISGALTNNTNAPVAVSYSITPTSGSCQGSSFNTTITVNPTPSITSLSQPICSSNSFSIAPTNGSGNIVPNNTTYSWSAPSISGITGALSANNASIINGTLTNNTNAPVAISYSITPTSGSCQGSSFNTSITVNPRPSISALSQTICSSNSFSIAPTNGSGNIVPNNTTYSWSAPSISGITGASSGNNASIISGTLTNNTNTPVAVYYSITPTSGSCQGSSFILTLNVNPKPNIITPQSDIRCSGESFLINPTNGAGNIIPSGTTYSWSAPSVPGIIGTAGGTNSNSISGNLSNATNTLKNVAYTVTPTSGSCPGSNFSATVTIKPRPTIASNVQEVCSNTLYQGNWGMPNIVPSITNYTWSVTNNTQVVGETNNTVAQSFGQTLTNLTLQNQTVVYNVTPVADGCIGNAFTLNLDIKPAPIANAGQDFTKTCVSNTNGNTIGSAPIPGFTYSWSPSSNLSSSTAANPNANPGSTTSYTLTVTDILSGCSATDQATVTVDNITPVADAGIDGAITCIQNTNGFTIGTPPSLNTSYSWSPVNGLSTSNSSSTIAHPNSTTQYTLIATNLSNGCSVSDQVSVTVNENTPNSNAGSDFTKTCTSFQNGNTIGMTNVPGITYSWAPTLGLGAPNSSNTSANPSQTTLYTLTSTDTTNGCTSSDQVLVTVDNSAPTAYAGLDATITCNQNSTGAILGMLPVNGISYSWTPTSGLSSSNQSEVIANPNGNTTYTLTATNTTNGCVSSDAVAVNIDVTPPLVDAGNDQIICQGEQVSLNGTSNGAQVNWTPSFLVQNPNQMSTVGNISGTTTFTLTATGNNGCIAQDYVTAQISIVPSSGLNTSYEICQNETLDLIVNSGVTCSWSGIYTGVGNSVSLGGLESGLLNLNLTNNDGCAASETISVVVNPIPYPIISGAQAVCQNSYWEKYSVPSTSNELAWSVTNGELMSFDNANDAIVHWGLGNAGIINVTETILQTGCSNNYSYEVLLDNSIALDTAEVLQLSSNVLYTPQDYTFMNWGYQSVQTNIPVSVGVYSQYCNFPNFDPSQNYYWVEIGDGNGCVTKSYFNNPIFTADLEHITSQHIQVFPNPTSGFVTIETDFSEFNFEIITMEGQVLKSGKGSYSIDFTDLNYPSGVYYLNISSNGSLFKHKIIKL